MEPLAYSDVLGRLHDDLILRQLSPHTVSSYLAHARLFLTWTARPVDALDAEDIRRFLVWLLRDHPVAPATVNVYSAAIRFLFAVTLNRSLNYLQIPRQKVPEALPVILSRSEVGALIAHGANLKHRAWLAMAYGSGLRVSEIAALRTAAIDSSAMRVMVRGGKGHKDRYTLLSQAALAALRAYWRAYRPADPAGWLFPSTGSTGHVTSDAIQQAFARAAAAVPIGASVSIHTLRHCFATHLLEDGAALLQIKELLGHRSIQSTTVYLHLAHLSAGLQSPLDTFFPTGASDAR